MKTIDIKEAVLQINQLLEMAAEGKEIIITKNHKPIVKLISAKTKKYSTLQPDFDEPIIEPDF